jgi:hypothetical protein
MDGLRQLQRGLGSRALRLAGIAAASGYAVLLLSASALILHLHDIEDPPWFTVVAGMGAVALQPHAFRMQMSPPEDRLRDWFQTHMVGFSDPKFKRNFRMDRATFQHLVGAVAPLLRPSGENPRALSVEHKLSLTVYKMPGDTYRV